MPAGNLPLGNGKAIIFSAPSGAGKTTLVRNLMKCSSLSLGFSVSATTREKRSNEIEGEAYHFVSSEEFTSLVEGGKFVEWEEVYDGVRYGTLCSEIESLWASGLTPVFDIDAAGGKTLKSVFGDSALAIFVMTPSLEVLEKRLRKRQTDDEASIQKRIDKAAVEISKAPFFDVQLENDVLQTAIDETERLVTNFLSQ
jgi:guanylate kinase|tara:strand:+ start:58 stop:651 length:594 start_codon:yes stop_codon:yes gene_type:complete